MTQSRPSPNLIDESPPDASALDSAISGFDENPVFSAHALQEADRVAIFIDGANLFYAAAHLRIEVDYVRLLQSLTNGRRLLRAYYYTGVDPSNEKQQGFLLWMRRHGYRVVAKDLVQFPDGSRKANLLVEMAVDMLRLAEYCDTLILLSGDGELAYALNNLSYRGVQIEVVSLRIMTSERLIDIADRYRDLTHLQPSIQR
ncbi:LabA-like NYN domain-containing protein [Lyngbya confervoides]|uniref:NYN domain-containing protein n=1 Tax=Lyngbya confervoides BDU141951 TaxID=1574623 RepID=A0ABD4T2Q9_9CYAN|nr:NYN domain-containing protein [Lyngbya confervoides]MCM1982819.1 NYN domain-containing protein [Lyngbya confervoides BDU141951]